jgi:hypothetical protein
VIALPRFRSSALSYTEDRPKRDTTFGSRQSQFRARDQYEHGREVRIRARETPTPATPPCAALVAERRGRLGHLRLPPARFHQVPEALETKSGANAPASESFAFG